MDDDERWAAVAARDEGADDRFVYGVLTTGVYCRPSCPARRPARRNVRFFAGPDDAEAAGLRACRRCDPCGPGPAARRADLVARACRVLDGPGELPTLAALAAEVGVSPFHLHRTFTAAVGVTPRAYAAARRAERARAGLESGPDTSVTDAIYGAGYGSSSRFYEGAAGRLGTTPSRYRRGAPGEVVRVAVADTSLGPVVVAATSRGVCTIELGDDPAVLVQRVQDRFHAAELAGDDPAFSALVATVVGLVEAPRSPATDLPLDVRGTAFQERVWQALRQLPPGATVTYGELAAQLGAPGSARAVAAACAANQLAVAVPCHRVVRADGGLAGYRWGVERKAALLEREGAEVASAAIRPGVGGRG